MRKTDVWEAAAMRSQNGYVIGRENNVVLVDFTRRPEPPAPRFPGASGLRERGEEAGEVQAWIVPERVAVAI